ncbi:MAG: MnhB domain-containing protein [Thiocapsa sp.]|jgi:multisubunit Na+/H+ antiporter MnhB subunit|nr:MnhB domain-containing protein [Thiocapsa sp.]MCG6985020.1 MnhB domain-containing protein [Thiocapsa sp.]
MKRREAAITALVLVLSVVLAWAFWNAFSGPTGDRLAELTATRVPESGVTNPVTAVLLNFRAYDTLLELAVLLAAILGIWAVGKASPGFLPAGAVLRALVGLIVPLLIIAGGYMLWVGGHAPGGAFQAGALLGAAGVTLRLAGYPAAGLPPEALLRVTIGLGVLIFTLCGVALMALGYGFLTYPLDLAKWLILVIETAATLSIGATLAAAYLGGRADPTDSGDGVTR